MSSSKKPLQNPNRKKRPARAPIRPLTGLAVAGATLVAVLGLAMAAMTALAPHPTRALAVANALSPNLNPALAAPDMEQTASVPDRSAVLDKDARRTAARPPIPTRIDAATALVLHHQQARTATEPTLAGELAKHVLIRGLASLEGEIREQTESRRMAQDVARRAAKPPVRLASLESDVPLPLTMPPAVPPASARASASVSSSAPAAAVIVPLPARRPQVAKGGTAPAVPTPTKAVDRPAPVLAYAKAEDTKDDSSGFGGLSKIFRQSDPRLPSADSGIAVYDIKAATVYMPGGEKLEAHSGLGRMKDNPNYTTRRNRGPTPPNVYKLRMREALYHGVEAIRMLPADEDAMHGRDGFLTHTSLVRGTNGSHGCVAFKHYSRFLKAFKSGRVKKMIVVPDLTQLPTYMASL